MTERDGVSGPPPELAEWMLHFGGETEGAMEARFRIAAGLRALKDALGRTGRDREGARALLSADGWITLAVREVAEQGDPESELRRLLDAVASVSPEAGE